MDTDSAAARILESMIWHAAAITLLIAGIILFLWSWFWDRPNFRGRPKHRCPKCWYDLTESTNPPITCPECGRVCKTERSTTHTRRHKRIALLAFLLVLASPIAALTPAYHNGTLLSKVPTGVLVQLLPITPEWRKHLLGPNRNQNHPGFELSRRLSGNGKPMTHEDYIELINTIAEGNLFAKPGSPRWAKTTGDWFGGQSFRFKDSPTGQVHYPDGTPADQALLDAFERLSNVLPQWDPKTRAVWPEGEVITLWSGYEHPSWFSSQLYESATLIIRGHQPEPERVEIKDFLSHFQLKARGKSGDHIECDITLNYHRVPPDWGWNPEEPLPPIKTEQFSISWDIVSTMKDAVRSVDSQEIHEALIVHTAQAIPQSLDDFEFHEDFLEPQFDQIGFGVIIQVYDADEFLGQSEHRWMANKGEWIGRITSMIGTPWEKYTEYPQRAADAQSRGSLRLKIIGDPILAMEIREAQTVWKGEIDITYQEAMVVIDQYQAMEEQ